MATGLSRKQPLDTTGYYHDRSTLPPEEQAPINLRAWFPAADSQEVIAQGAEQAAADSRRLELEIGSGKGTFLVQQAPHEPHKVFLGMEWDRPYARYAADRFRRLNIRNTHMLHADGTDFMATYVPDKAIGQFHWYFPDPWPKKRHYKRRTFQEPFLRLLHTKLMDSIAGEADTGCVRVVTDHLEYWEWMQEHAQKVTDIFAIEPYVPPVSAGEGEWVGTNFERKYIPEGRTFNGMILRKIPGAE